MSDAREALPAAEDVLTEAVCAFYQALRSADPDGWATAESVDMSHWRGPIRAALDAAGVSALRAEVERLREVSVAQPYETERELAVALDEARQQLADLRAGIEALADTKPGATGRALRTLLAGSGEQPGEVTHACPPPGDEGLTPCCGRTPFELPSTDRMTLDAELVTCHHPAPAVPDVVRELDAVMHHHADRADAAEAEADRLAALLDAAQEDLAAAEAPVVPDGPDVLGRPEGDGPPHLAREWAASKRAATAALAVLSDPEVLAGIAGVLREHGWVYTQPVTASRCACGERPDDMAEHQATAVADWLRGRG